MLKTIRKRGRGLAREDYSVLERGSRRTQRRGETRVTLTVQHQQQQHWEVAQICREATQRKVRESNKRKKKEEDT